MTVNPLVYFQIFNLITLFSVIPFNGFILTLAQKKSNKVHFNHPYLLSLFSMIAAFGTWALMGAFFHENETVLSWFYWLMWLNFYMVHVLLYMVFNKASLSCYEKISVSALLALTCFTLYVICVGLIIVLMVLVNNLFS